MHAHTCGLMLRFPQLFGKEVLYWAPDEEETPGAEGPLPKERLAELLWIFPSMAPAGPQIPKQGQPFGIGVRGGETIRGRDSICF